MPRRWFAYPWPDFTWTHPCCQICGVLAEGRSRKRDKCQNTEVYPQVETEPCPCEVFTSQPHGNWSDCTIRGGPSELQLGMPSQGVSKECGEGVRLRAIACYDGTGRLVEPSRCSSSGYIEEPCTVPCPFDCKLSDWSSWSPCSSSCGPGVKVRSKWLKEKPYNGGRPCPKLDLKNQFRRSFALHPLELDFQPGFNTPRSLGMLQHDVQVVCPDGKRN
ncbi:hypothetical protein BTVI_56872 [Pitangus sulphuratus]|nr:hypothetical protein BTVI_56872 [Pitangus sulphuratus]